MKIHASSPYFFVSDIEKSVRFYVDILGFDQPKLWGDPPMFAMPSKDGFIVMLNQDESKVPHPNGRDKCWDAYFWCDAVDEFYQSIAEKGVDIVHGPEIREDYGMKEVGIRDLDGYMLVFAEDIEG